MRALAPPGLCALGLCALLFAGCISDRPIEIAIVPPRDADGEPDVPAEVVTWELRLARLEGDEVCPTANEAARAAPIGSLAHAQTFAASSGAGVGIGEVPPGRWALVAIARDGSCAPRLFGCAPVGIGSETPATLTVEVAAVVATETCGCRACEAGGCTPVETVCE